MLIIGSVWVSPDASAAGSRMLQLIEFFLAQGASLTFATAAQKNEHALSLSSLGISELTIAVNDDAFNRTIQELNPTLVLFDRFTMEEHYGWRVRECCPDALQILDTEDLHSLRAARQEALKKGIDFQFEDLLPTDLAKREVASIFRSDLSLIISSVEMEVLQRYCNVPSQLLLQLPFMVSQIDKEAIKKTPSFYDRSHFVFVGNYKHAPNVDAVLQLKKILWPEISKQLPEAELHIYGAFTTQQIEQCHRVNERFLVKGHAENLANLLRSSRVLLAPLRFGAGLKGKLLEAMRYGLPSVTTQIGAEGMHADMPWNGVVSETNEDFVSAAIQLYTTPTLWETAQQHGVQLVNTCYDKDRLATRFLAKITLIQNDLLAHRTQNFIGAMLQHHHMQSTKYLSKWISEKNKQA